VADSLPIYTVHRMNRENNHVYVDNNILCIYTYKINLIVSLYLYVVVYIFPGHVHILMKNYFALKLNLTLRDRTFLSDFSSQQKS